MAVPTMQDEGEMMGKHRPKGRSSQAGAGRTRGKYRFPEKPGGECGPVTVTKADGTVEVKPALTREQLNRVVPEPKTRKRGSRGRR